ncbi:MAG: hypothetical protein JWQ38_1663 [Flavipsychrobacter sp.]|nr:hypothetical protein [Flavipsychrobacter sp.]
MKQTLALTACLFLSAASFAQNTKEDPATTQRNLIASGRCELTGNITDARNHPISGVQVFIYGKDSAIAASGFSDAVGRYETNPLVPGVYDVKLVYPVAKGVIRTTIAGVTMKKGFNALNMKANTPDADATIPATDVMPKPAVKEPAKKK